MAASCVSRPGEKFGPCETCQHKDCAELRAIAAASCTHCRKPIGYATRYYRADDGQGYDHAACAEDAADAEVKAIREAARKGVL